MDRVVLLNAMFITATRSSVHCIIICVTIWGWYGPAKESSSNIEAEKEDDDGAIFMKMNFLNNQQPVAH